MFKRTGRILGSYLRGKQNEYNGYLGLPEQPSRYDMPSPESRGDRARQNARYAGKGTVGQATAKAYGMTRTALDNLDTIGQINRDVTVEQREKRAKQAASKSRNRRRKGVSR